jgi:hypothetical protein
MNKKKKLVAVRKEYCENAYETQNWIRRASVFDCGLVLHMMRSALLLTNSSACGTPVSYTLLVEWLNDYFTACRLCNSTTIIKIYLWGLGLSFELCCPQRVRSEIDDSAADISVDT